MKNKIIFGVLLVILSGCSMFGHQKVVQKKETFQQTPQQIQISGNIVAQEKLKRGSKIAFTDLKAGPLAVADEKTDRVSLKVIQGVTDVFLNSDAGITITNDPHDANLVFEGYIEEFTQPGKFSKMILMKHQSRISISGEVYERNTGLRVLSFASAKTFNTSKENSSQAALSIGNAIGQFICNHAKEKP